jgi:uncharacterized protein with HEPN domain
MRPREDREAAFLDDIRGSCSAIASRIARRRFPDLAENPEFRDGLVLQLIIIGEASKQLSDATKKLYIGAPWREMIKLRDLFIHHYWTIDAARLWQIVQEDVPKLLALLGDP